MIEKANDVYIASLDMVIKPYWDKNKFKYFDVVSWNEAIEQAALDVAKKIKYPTEACAAIRSMKK